VQPAEPRCVESSRRQGRARVEPGLSQGRAKVEPGLSQGRAKVEPVLSQGEVRQHSASVETGLDPIEVTIRLGTYNS